MCKKIIFLKKGKTGLTLCKRVLPVDGLLVIERGDGGGLTNDRDLPGNERLSGLFTIQSEEIRNKVKD